jgi:uncharacterized damage-inducible protein DinB
MPILARPGPVEHADYYSRYVAAVPEGDVIAHLAAQVERTQALLRSVGEARAAHRYAPSKWSIKQVVGHMADTERVFTFRALAFARRDPSPLPSMEQEAWMAGADFDARPLRQLAEEFHAVRQATLALFSSFTPDVLARTGTASGNRFTVNSLVFIVAGHELHHLAVLAERYGVKAAP